MISVSKNLTEGIKSLSTFNTVGLTLHERSLFICRVAGAGATFVMSGFRLHFGWDCAEGEDTECTPATLDRVDTDKGLINGLFAFTVQCSLYCLIDVKVLHSRCQLYLSMNRVLP